MLKAGEWGLMQLPEGSSSKHYLLPNFIFLVAITHECALEVKAGPPTTYLPGLPALGLISCKAKPLIVLKIGLHVPLNRLIELQGPWSTKFPGPRHPGAPQAAGSENFLSLRARTNITNPMWVWYFMWNLCSNKCPST